MAIYFLNTVPHYRLSTRTYEDENDTNADETREMRKTEQQNEEEEE